MNSPSRLLLILTGTQLVCLLFVFISLLSHAWIKVEKGKEAQTFGIFSSCFIQEMTTSWNEKEYDTQCTHCIGTDDAPMKGDDVSLGSLRAARAFAVLTLITAIVLSAAVVLHAMLMVFDVQSVPLEKLFISVAIFFVVQFCLMLVTLICTSRFMNQIDGVFLSEGVQTVETLDFGYGKVLSWITWLLMLCPVGVAGFMLYQMFSAK